MGITKENIYLVCNDCKYPKILWKSALRDTPVEKGEYEVTIDNGAKYNSRFVTHRFWNGEKWENTTGKIVAWKFSSPPYEED